MNASGFTGGGLVSTNTFWKVSIPLVVGSIIVPVALSGLLLRKTVQVVYESNRPFRRFLRSLVRFIPIMLGSLACFGVVAFCCFYYFAVSRIQRFRDRHINDHDRQNSRQASSDNNEGVSDQALEMA